MANPSLLSLTLQRHRLLLLAFYFFVPVSVCIAQQADFTITPLASNNCYPLTVKFTDISNATGVTWDWTFGNSNGSSDQNPSATYTAPGTYMVTLKLSNGTQKTLPVVVHDKPAVTFSVQNASGCTPLTVDFVDTTSPASGAIVSRVWDFGDGASDNGPTPSHTYTASGSRTVVLNVTNEHGCSNTDVRMSAVTALGPVAKFRASVISACQVPATINFTNQSTPVGALSYTWDFKDGTPTRTAENQSHTFVNMGSYNVELKARDAGGCESTHSLTVNVGSEGGLDFTPSATKVCVGQNINFTVALEPGEVMLSHRWYYDATRTSTDPSPPVSYATPGVYDIQLRALLANKTCQSIVTKTVEVVADPVPSFTYTTDCNYNVTFRSTSTGAQRVEWYIQNVLRSTAASFTHPFSFPGDFTVRLDTYNSLNCTKKSSERIIRVNAKPEAAFTPILSQDCGANTSLSGCAPFTVAFTNKSTAPTAFTSLWSFSDGTSSTSTDHTHTFGQGNHTVTLKITAGDGCTATRSAPIVVSGTTPVANFVIDKTNVCTRDPVKFTSASQNANFWCWDFGDGETGRGSQVTHSYKKPGTYTVTLTAKNAGCAHTKQIINAVKVNPPEVEFKIVKNCADPFTVGLTNLSNGYSSLKWDFGDGKSSLADVAGHTYDNVGDYTVSLWATNATTGCAIEVKQSVSIVDIRADFEIDNPRPCKGAPVKFTDKSDFAVKWDWSLGNNKSDQNQNTTTSYNSSGTFQVQLIAYDADGCADVKVIPVNVLDMQGNFTFTALSDCNTLDVQFTDASTGSPIISSLEWDFGDNTPVSNAMNPQHDYTVLGTYPVTLTLTNADGTCSFIRQNAIVFTNPVPDISSVKPGFCIGEPIQLFNASTNATTFKWLFDGVQTSTAVHPPLRTYAATGQHDVTLFAKDNYGCEQKVEMPDLISITKPVAKFNAANTFSECPPLMSTFDDISEGDVRKWDWDFGNGGRSVLPDAINTYLRPGIFDVSLTVTDANGCTDTRVAPKIVTVGGPDGSFTTVLQPSACLFDTVAFTSTTTNTAIHRWDFGDGVVEDLAVMDARHRYNLTGPFVVSLVLIDEKGCKVVANGDVQLAVHDSTVVDFSYAPECIFQGDPFTLKASAPEQEQMVWSWQVNRNTYSTEAEQNIQADTAGQYLVTLKAVNSFGCRSTVTREVPVHGNISFIPNIFTPNNDGYNNFFEIIDLEKSMWDLHVYNRWGDRVYTKNHYANNWNGGNLATGVYYFVLINAYCSEKSYKGHVTITK